MDNDDDEQKVQILGCQQDQWLDIADKVETWSHSRWAVWTETKPEWFTKNFIESVPDRYIPADVLLEFNRAAPDGKRKRLSVRESVRNSIVRNSVMGSHHVHGVRLGPVALPRGDDNILSSNSNVNRVTIRPREENMLFRVEEGRVP